MLNRYYCDTVKFNVTKIKWDLDESKSPNAELPSKILNRPVRGFPHWQESEWKVACIDQIEDEYNCRVRGARVERCENE